MTPDRLGWISRRRALVGGAGLLVLPGVAFGRVESREGGAAPASFPAQEPEAVIEVVGKSHFDLARVTELVSARPALARAAVDWGFGDWETALGAASHTGRREIAEVLIAHGARPNLFTHAMLGHVDVVRATIGAMPEAAQIRGPHSIPLIEHARAGGEAAGAVVAYLESIGAAPEPARALGEAELSAYVGVFAFGPGETERLVTSIRRGRLSIERAGGSARFLTPVSEHAFFPAGAEAVRIVFEVRGGRAEAVTVHDPEPVVRAERVEG